MLHILEALDCWLVVKIMIISEIDKKKTEKRGCICGRKKISKRIICKFLVEMLNGLIWSEFNLGFSGFGVDWTSPKKKISDQAQAESNFASGRLSPKIELFLFWTRAQAEFWIRPVRTNYCQHSELHREDG